MRTKTNQYPKVGDWREVEIKQYNWTNDYPLLDLEIVIYEADALYTLMSSSEVFKNAYQKYVILDNKTGITLEKEFIGESSYYDIRREINDFVSKEILKELKALRRK